MKTGVKITFFGLRGSGFGEPDGTAPPRIPRGIPGLTYSPAC